MRSPFKLYVWCIAGLLAAFAACQAQAKPDLRPTPDTQTLFASHKGSVVQVRLIPKSANEHSALGSGFVVRHDTGATNDVLLVTNYHVISSLAIDPEKYRIELRGTDEQRLGAELVAFDVVNDLAVLRTVQRPKTGTWPALKWRTQPLVQGQKLYALGNPFQLGFVITEGPSNSEVEARWQRQLLFSGALNSGMSGGPALDANGDLVGVNVSKRVGAELLNFLVPAEFAKALFEQVAATGGATDRVSSATTAKPGASAAQGQPWRPILIEHLLAHQARVTQAVVTQQGLSFSTGLLANRNVVTISGNASRCNAGTRQGDALRFERDSLTCRVNADVFVASSQLGASVEVGHVLLKNTALSSIQFLRVHAPKREYNWNDPRNMALEHCTDTDIATPQKRHYRVATCVRAWRRFEGLYQYKVTAVQLDDASQRLVSRLELTGVSFESGLALTRAFLGQLQ